MGGSRYKEGKERNRERYFSCLAASLHAHSRMLNEQLKSALNGRLEKKTLRGLTLHSTTPHLHSNFIPTQSSAITSSHPQSSRPTRSSAGLIDFSSNDYLSIATSPTLHSLFSAKIREDMHRGLKMGSSGSRLLDGNSEHHLQVSALSSAISEARTLNVLGF